MRVRNKELLRKWHRKEQRIKELIAEAKKSKGDAPAKVVKAVAKPAPVEKKAPAPKKPKAEGVVAEKPKKAPAKKKTEEAPAAE